MPCGVRPEKIRIVNDDTALRENIKHVQFTNGHYEFRLRNGKIRKFRVAIEGESSGARYLLADYLKKPGLFWLTEFYPNSEFSNSFIFLEDQYGIEHQVNGIPLFHENCNRFITVDVCDFGCSGEIALWDKPDGYQSWRRVWSFVPYDYWINSEERWVSNNEVLITKEVYRTRNVPNSGAVKRTLILNLTEEGWKMRESPADAHNNGTPR
jgi:hypothetical protein